MARAPRLCFALAHALAAVAAPVRVADDSFLFLDNGLVRVGVDVTRGGSIGWLSTSGGRNLVNHADMGREVQLSFYAGPDPYNPSDLCHSGEPKPKPDPHTVLSHASNAA